MKRRWFFRGIKFALGAAFVIALGGAIVMQLWNFVVPSAFGGPAIHFAQALALLVLARILVGRFGPRGVGPGIHWRRHLQERWQQMSPEERERLRARFGHHCGWREPPAGEPRA